MSLDRNEIFKLLQTIKTTIEEKIEEDLRLNFGGPTILKEACAYSLMSGGKRFRPFIVLMVAKALGKNLPVLDAAIAVEYFHTASLIADDLPCMDDDDERRGRPSLHKAFNEATAILASYALISAGYRAIYQNAILNPDSGERLAKALEIVAYNTGAEGAALGQHLDIFPPDDSLQTLLLILNKKTVTLFEVAFTLGWIFGGGDLNQLNLVKKLSFHFGMAFQIADDLDDLAQDEGQKQSVNLAKVIGVKESTLMLEREKNALIDISKELQLNSPEFLALVASI